ncbi:helix-turn-helix domain-containing protein [Gelidibacter gilvus]|uniref:AraC family transcriptional regulator n=1 Tax=Gelidibacter gilvus TaxID=59602 RepID=A0A4Q0XK95_9FLAO|nr:helix-turn-helix domain-containing protein [Gelidibacter gilvus]RXJ52659.1 AraC family transcriptional regulator [Gelidibacter gilvus]
MISINNVDGDKNSDWLIRRYESYQFCGPSVSDKFIPRPYIYLMFHFKDRPFITQDLPIQLESLFVAPIVPAAFTLTFQGEMDSLAVACNATVFSRVFEVDLSPVSKRSINLPQPSFYQLWQTLADLTTTDERIAYFSEFINAVQKSCYCPDAVDMLYNKIVEKSITTPLKTIIQECHASKSTLLRKFVKRTGVSPKTLARIVRLDYLWAKIRDEHAVDYQSLVFDGNYYDQSHFINDFKAIVGETPGYFFNRNLSIVKLFSGKTTENN